MSPFKKLYPLVQLLPAVAVAGVIAVTLPHTSPVLAAVPERLTPAAEVSDTAEEPEEEPEVLPALPYPDGVYTGSSRGYGGKVKVQVTMKNGFITDLKILDASHETAAFLKRAKRLLNIVQEEQTWEVDAVSEATYTSRGILGAIQNALTGEEVINPAPPRQEIPEEPPVIEEFTAPSAYRDGIYTGTAQGFGGDITVQVTISNDTITDISIVSAEGETRSYFTRARYVISDILTRGTPEVDAVSGATYSSTGIINAVRSALMKAANDPEQAPETADTAEETPAASEASAEEADSEVPETMEPVVEVVKPEEKPADLFEQIRKFWMSLFPEETGASSAASEPTSESESDSQSEPVPEQPAESVDTEEPPAESSAETQPEEQEETE